ncbi:MAG TPA: hypothetical protein VJ461_00865 [Candidatus Nanoarchaeia archaeon]|nr:hypothetical protein [Candidatus Nanoarchaeia archaeon]
MVFFLLLGFMDMLVAALMLATHFGFLNEWKIAIMSAVYLIGKGLMLRGSVLSSVDIAAGVYFILMMLGLRTFLVYVFAIFLCYKFVTSLIMRGWG